MMQLNKMFINILFLFSPMLVKGNDTVDVTKTSSNGLLKTSTK